MVDAVDGVTEGVLDALVLLALAKQDACNTHASHLINISLAISACTSLQPTAMTRQGKFGGGRKEVFVGILELLATLCRLARYEIFL